MIYSEEALAKLQNDRAKLNIKYIGLAEAFNSLTLHDPIAAEYMQHGFLRRISYLARCIENAFSIIPPSMEHLPQRNQLVDVTISLHAFWINIFGSIDNLAWIWVRERRITQPNGAELPNTWVGLKRRNKLVRESFSPNFTQYLQGLDNWFDTLEGYRNGLAHRIPFYIPPYRVLEADRPKYELLSQQMSIASSSSEHEELSARIDTLKAFRSMMMHSYSENARPIMFHAQMLADYSLMEELGHKMLKELSQHGHPSPDDT